MKTFYLTQGGALEEYLNGSNGNGNGRGNGIDDPDHPGCQGICNSNAQPDLKEACGCGDGSVGASIDSFGFTMLTLFLIGIVVWTKLENKKSKENK